MGSPFSKIVGSFSFDLVIQRFHAIYWPAILMALDLPPPKSLLVHAHWTMDRQKMSKSRGNVADPLKAMRTYGVDPVRYYLMRNAAITDDSGESVFFGGPCVDRLRAFWTIFRLVCGSNHEALSPRPGWDPRESTGEDHVPEARGKSTEKI